jgi:ribonuclease HI
VRSDIPPQDDDELFRRGRLRSPVLVEATQMLWTRSSLKGRVIIEDIECAKATAESWTTPDKGIAMFTDGSKSEDGWTGCAAVWKLLGSREWQGRKIFMGRNKEVFDAELYAIWIALRAARDNQDAWAAHLTRLGGPQVITIFTDAQAALKRIRDDEAGPGQWLARRIIRVERQLRQKGWLTEFRWIPGHKGIEGNEVADQWAKEGAGASGAECLPREEASITTLAHVARGVTEKKWQEHLAWVKERCHGKRYYLLRERQHTDPVASRARKTLAARFYQLRMGKAFIGPYLAQTGRTANDKCWWCSSDASQTRDHLFKRCTRWKEQQAILWRAVGKATDRKRTVRNTSMAQLFGDERCTAAILEFLATTEVGLSLRGQVARQIAGVEDDVEAEDEVEADDEVDAEDVDAVFDPGGRAVERVM